MKTRRQAIEARKAVQEATCEAIAASYGGELTFSIYHAGKRRRAAMLAQGAQHTPGPLVPNHFKTTQAPAAWALKEAREKDRPFSINKRVRAYTGPIYVGVFS
jgi:hypothetical protein